MRSFLALSTTVPEEASMLARMLACARRSIVVADGSKFGFNTFAQIAPLTAIDTLVTDISPPPELSQALSQANVEVIVAPSCFINQSFYRLTRCG